MNSLIAERPYTPLTGIEARIAAQIQCKRDLKFLCANILGFKDWDVCHDELYTFLKTPKKNKKLILMPRGHLKSSIVTIGYSMQRMLANPDIRILLANAVWDNARSFLSEIKSYLSEKSILPFIFSKFESQLWNQDEITIELRQKPNKTPTYSTAGADKALASQHYDLIIMDDVVNRQTVGTAEQRDKSIKLYSDALDLLEPDGELIIIGTRWMDDDMYGYLIGKQKDQFDIYKVGATKDGRIDGEVIFPNKFSTNTLKELLKAKGSFEFYSQYFNECMSPESQHFKPPVRYWNSLDDKSIHTVTFDPATSEKKDACDAVILDACVNGSNQLCVTDYTIFEKKDPMDMIDQIFKYCQMYKVQDVGIEVNGGQEIYIKLIEEEQRKRNVFFKINPIRQHHDKFSRIIALQPRWESGNLLLKQGMIELEEQMLRFPVSKKLDIIDCLAMQLQIARPQYLVKPKVYIPPQYRVEN